MADQEAHFSVDTRLTRLLGETYRSSEAALKELVDNAWDADASNVWISLPEPVSTDSIFVKDDGTGMTPLELRGEYLNIASDKRRRTGDKTPRLNRKIKGRKGIGKFAGLTIAGRMQVVAVARERRCSLLIDKSTLLSNEADLEAVPLPFIEEEALHAPTGTTIELSELDSRLNFPVPDKLREVLVHEYGREDSFKVFVNNVPLSVMDVPGATTQADHDLPISGPVRLQFTVADGKRPPRSPGIILKVDGKAVGKPMLFGLDEDDEIPIKLAKRVYGEVEMSGLDDFVTADWGAVIENSKAFQEAQEHVQAIVKASLKETHARDMQLQKARLQRQIDKRLEKLPEHRRRYAQDALNRILKRFYGESDERIATIADVALDAMEHDAYWIVFERINETSHGEVSEFAVSLEEFGLLELSTVAAQAARRRSFLDFFDQLAQNPLTLEKDVHKAFETNLWMLGRRHSMMASNVTLGRIIEDYCSAEYKGDRAAKRPDLLLSQDVTDSYLLIEFKRPSHSITRDDIAQAEKYRDDLSARLSSTSKMEILMVGKGKASAVNAQNMAVGVTINSYDGIISAARNELEWLVSSLK
ncbi:ATP-binding protein [Sphingobium sp. ZW T5_29]|uniref:ATP-binding protein n=1 Tax=Sphingobium sp. ZW T5_29 TaxID=3378077 RepID=UPI0038548F15